MRTENEPGDSSREVLEDGPMRPVHLLPILQNVAEGVVSVNRDQEIAFFNRGAQDIFGYRAEEVTGQSLDILLPERFWQDHWKQVATFEGTGVTSRRMGLRLEVKGRRKNGEEFPAEASITYTRGADRDFLTALVRDVTEQKRLEEELERQAETLRHAVESRDAFIATLSHDLRVPLNAIMGYVQLIEEGIGVSVDRKAQPYVRSIGRASHFLLQIIEELLTFSRLEAGREEVQTDWVEPAEMVEEARSIIQPLARKKGLEFRTEVGEVPQRVKTDPKKVRRVLLNLLGNAVKFTEQGEVRLSVQQRDDRLLFEVIDTGSGIPEDEQKRLFDPFQKGRSAVAEDSEGIGLGLAISKRIARLLDGDLDVESTDGEGSCFRFSLVGADAGHRAAKGARGRSQRERLGGPRDGYTRERGYTGHAERPSRGPRPHPPRPPGP